MITPRKPSKGYSVPSNLVLVLGSLESQENSQRFFNNNITGEKNKC